LQINGGGYLMVEIILMQCLDVSGALILAGFWPDLSPLIERAAFRTSIHIQVSQIFC
jgi:hypothetical protein